MRTRRKQDSKSPRLRLKRNNYANDEATFTCLTYFPTKVTSDNHNVIHAGRIGDRTEKERRSRVKLNGPRLYLLVLMNN